MKKFKFRLKTLLKIRKHKEKEALMVLAQLQERERVIKNKIAEIIRTRELWASVYSREAKVHLDPRRILLIETYLIGLDHARKYQEELLVELHVEMSRAIESVRQAYREKRQVEHLEETQREEYLVEFKRWELKQMSELSVLRFNHQGPVQTF